MTYKQGEQVGFGYWCAYCQCVHSVRSCFHPGRVYTYELEATATRRLELLRDLEWGWTDNGLERCPECGGYKEKYERLGERYNDRIGHAKDCKLAKELADAVGSQDGR